MDQENNQLLLNAIKNKFAAQNGNANSTPTSCSPPTFTIPALKAFNSGGGFALPKLTMGAKESKFSIPLLGGSASLASLNESLHNLKVSAEQEQKSEKKSTLVPAAIDLTAALSSGVATTSSSSSRLEMRIKAATAAAAAAVVEDFQIFFVSDDWKLQHSLVAPPSACGRILCLSYARALRRRPQQAPRNGLIRKHKIQRFCFDTKSPDDIVLATLSKHKLSHT